MAQLLAINPQGNIIANKMIPNMLGWYSDMIDISNDGNIWEVTNSSGNSSTMLTIYNSQDNLVTQITTDIPMLTSVKVSASTDIGWVGGQNYTSTGIITPELEALNISGQTLTSYTLPPPSISSFNVLVYVKLAISTINGTIWAWSPGYLSGYSFTGLVYGPYPINIVESFEPYQIDCGGINEKWIIVNPVTNDIWMGNPATTTVLALLPDGTVQFQKDLDIYASTMAVSPKTGNVWIGSNNKIDVLDPYGKVIKQLTIKNLNCITYIAISPLDDTVWVGSVPNSNKNIFILDENGDIINSIYVPVKCELCS
ncbi:MAG: hypothetical protein M1381_09330 [Deltaproteobacteria bacterium]|nr:hypothetical protein [Deltaproteobacteria bacterium]MCL5792765.1 hypothetical protein [Deltaproteobacteria bacterium]